MSETSSTAPEYYFRFGAATLDFCANRLAEPPRIPIRRKTPPVHRQPLRNRYPSLRSSKSSCSWLKNGRKMTAPNLPASRICNRRMASSAAKDTVERTASRSFVSQLFLNNPTWHVGAPSLTFIRWPSSAATELPPTRAQRPRRWQLSDSARASLQLLLLGPPGRAPRPPGGGLVRPHPTIHGSISSLFVDRF